MAIHLATESLTTLPHRTLRDVSVRDIVPGASKEGTRVSPSSGFCTSSLETTSACGNFLGAEETNRQPAKCSPPKAMRRPRGAFQNFTGAQQQPTTTTIRPGGPVADIRTGDRSFQTAGLHDICSSRVLVGPSCLVWPTPGSGGIRSRNTLAPNHAAES